MEEKIRHWLPGLDKRFSVCMERKKKGTNNKGRSKEQFEGKYECFISVFNFKIVNIIYDFDL